MLSLITTPAEISRYQRLLEEYLHNRLPRAMPFKIGHLGGTYEVQVHTDDDLWHTGKLAGEPEPNRYWNAFGLLSSEHPSNIIVEVNIPLQGLNRRVAGMFAKEVKTDEVFILHRGGIGGGREGVGKSAFLAWYEPRALSRFTEVDEGSTKPARAIAVGRLSDERLLEGFYSFVRDVHDFKKWVAHHYFRSSDAGRVGCITSRCRPTAVQLR